MADFPPGTRVELHGGRQILHGSVVEPDESKGTVLVEWDEYPGQITEYLTARDRIDFQLKRVR